MSADGSVRVFFVPACSADGPNALSAKAGRALAALDFLEALEPEDFCALKIHFGERNNKGYIKPEWLRAIVAAVRAEAPRVFLTDSNTLYVGPRSNSVEHIRLAWSHGFRPDILDVPVIIADGLIGRDVQAAAGGGARVGEAKIASAILSADALLALSHVTGHVQTGIGAAIKNLGMGCASRAGKLDQHSVAHPRVQAKSCRDCGLCFDHCPAGAIVRAEGHVTIDDARCIGCGECLVVCKFGAIRIRWDEDYRRIQEKIAEYAMLVRRGFKRKAAFLNFLIRVTEDCDCMAKGEAAIVDDIGILASSDPVAVDQASADLILKTAGGRDVFRQGYDIDWSMQLKHGQSIGLGSRRYDLVTLEA
jgi:uncharacterized Fe-S center protein